MKKIDPKRLPYFVALVQAVMFSYVGVRYFGIWGWVIGPGVGAAVNLSLAVSSSKISDIAKKRQLLARTMYLSLFIISPATIALSLYVPDSVWTAIAWAAAPDLAIALTGAIVGGGLVEQEKPAKSQPKQRGFACKAKGCSFVGKTQAALNGHQAKHKRPINVTAEYESAKDWK